eukprot:gene37544-46317_t
MRNPNYAGRLHEPVQVSWPAPRAQLQHVQSPVEEEFGSYIDKMDTLVSVLGVTADIAEILLTQFSPKVDLVIERYFEVAQKFDSESADYQSEVMFAMLQTSNTALNNALDLEQQRITSQNTSANASSSRASTMPLGGGGGDYFYDEDIVGGFTSNNNTSSSSSNTSSSGDFYYSSVVPYVPIAQSIPEEEKEDYPFAMSPEQLEQFEAKFGPIENHFQFEFDSDDDVLCGDDEDSDDGIPMSKKEENDRAKRKALSKVHPAPPAVHAIPLLDLTAPRVAESKDSPLLPRATYHFNTRREDKPHPESPSILPSGLQSLRLNSVDKNIHQMDAVDEEVVRCDTDRTELYGEDAQTMDVVAESDDSFTSGLTDAPLPTGADSVSTAGVSLSQFFTLNSAPVEESGYDFCTVSTASTNQTSAPPRKYTCSFPGCKVKHLTLATCIPTCYQFCHVVCKGHFLPQDEAQATAISQTQTEITELLEGQGKACGDSLVRAAMAHFLLTQFEDSFPSRKTLLSTLSRFDDFPCPVCKEEGLMLQAPYCTFDAVQDNVATELAKAVECPVCIAVDSVVAGGDPEFNDAEAEPVFKSQNSTQMDEEVDWLSASEFLPTPVVKSDSKCDSLTANRNLGSVSSASSAREFGFEGFRSGFLLPKASVSNTTSSSNSSSSNAPMTSEDKTRTLMNALLRAADEKRQAELDRDNGIYSAYAIEQCLQGESSVELVNSNIKALQTKIDFRVKRGCEVDEALQVAMDTLGKDRDRIVLEIVEMQNAIMKCNIFEDLPALQTAVQCAVGEKIEKDRELLSQEHFDMMRRILVEDCNKELD